jgi:hypothetical protein
MRREEDNQKCDGGAPHWPASRQKARPPSAISIDAVTSIVVTTGVAAGTIANQGNEPKLKGLGAKNTGPSQCENVFAAGDLGHKERGVIRMIAGHLQSPSGAGNQAGDADLFGPAHDERQVVAHPGIVVADGSGTAVRQKREP